MTPIHVLNLCILHHRFECFRAWRNEYPVIFAPDCKNGGLVIAEVGVKLGVHIYVLAIVEEEVELDFGISRTIEEGLVEVICFWRNGGWVLFTRCILLYRF